MITLNFTSQHDFDTLWPRLCEAHQNGMTRALSCQIGDDDQRRLFWDALHDDKHPEILRYLLAHVQLKITVKIDPRPGFKLVAGLES